MTTTTTPTVTGTSPRRSLRLPVGDIALGVLGILTVVAVLEILPRTGLVNPAYLPPPARSSAPSSSCSASPRSGRTRRDAARMGDRSRDRHGRGHRPRCRHRQHPDAAQSDELDDRVPPPDSVGRADPACGAAVRHRHAGDAAARRLRQLLAGSRAGAVRRAGRRPGRSGDVAQLPVPRAHPRPYRHLADGAAVRRHRLPPRCCRRAHPRSDRRAHHRQSRARQPHRRGAVIAVPYASMYALVMVTGLIGVAVNVVARQVERRALRWHPSIRRRRPGDERASLRHGVLVVRGRCPSPCSPPGGR